ncbi:MAG: flagellar basal body P-ring formation chaperone FlgA [Betaproteobacteria bacterium]
MTLAAQVSALSGYPPVLPVTRSAVRLVLAFAMLAGVLASARGQSPQPDLPVLKLAVVATARVDSDRVTLGDVVTVLEDEGDVARRILDFGLAPTPRVAQVSHVQQSQLADRLRTRRTAAAIRIVWSGSPAAEVVRATQTIPAHDLDELARGELDGWLAARSETHSVEPARSAEPVAVPLGRVSLSVRPLPRIVAPSRHATVWIDVSVDGRFQRSVSLDYHVHALRTAWVAAEELARGQDIDATRLVQTEVDVAQLSRELWSTSPERTRMRRALHRGEPLTARDVELRPEVVRGERVEVFSQVGELSIQAQAEALQDGRAGQDVLVRIASSRSPVTARVLKPGLVEIRQ